MKEIVIAGRVDRSVRELVFLSLSSLLSTRVLVDCDLAGRGFRRIWKGRPEREEPFAGTVKVRIDSESCIGCGLCSEQCRFEAIVQDGEEEKYTVIPDKCVGCGVCQYICPEAGIHDVESEKGRCYRVETDYGTLFCGELDDPENNSGKLASLLRRKARMYASEREIEHSVILGPDGIGCGAMSTLSASDVLLALVDGTHDGLDSAKRILKLARYFRIDSHLLLIHASPSERFSEDTGDLSRMLSVPLIGTLNLRNRVSSDGLQDQMSAVLSPFLKGLGLNQLAKGGPEHIL